VAQLELITKPDKLADHHYPIQMIALAVFIVTQANGSLRCAAKTVGYFATMMGWEYAAPSHVTVDNWTRRLGFMRWITPRACGVNTSVSLTKVFKSVGKNYCFF
jgi:hypothetical protein